MLSPLTGLMEYPFGGFAEIILGWGYNLGGVLSTFRSLVHELVYKTIIIKISLKILAKLLMRLWVTVITMYLTPSYT